MKLSIIIVNYNTRDLLDNCLSSVVANGANSNLEILIVDNASTDGSAQMVRWKYPTVSIVENSENVGFAKANNQALKQAKGEYLLLLNSDTIVLPNALKNMAKFMDANPKVGALGAKLLDQNLVLQPSCRHFPTLFSVLSQFFGLSALFPKSKLFGKYDMGYWDHSQTRKVDCVPGTSLLVRKNTVQEVGLLDENYFMYCEDTDWCYRMNQAGWEVVFLPEAEVIHLGGASAGKTNRGLFYDQTLTKEFFHSLFYYFDKFHGSLSVLILRILIFLSLIMRMLKWIFTFLFGRIERKEFSYKMRSFSKMIKYCITSRS